MNNTTVDTARENREERVSSRVTGGFFLLAGAIFLLGSSGVTILGESAWSLVALLPIYWIGFAAYRCYKQDGRVSRRVFMTLAFGLIPFAYIAASVLDMDLDVGAIWPIVPIVIGVSFLLNGSDS